MSAGFAAADVAISGSAKMGVVSKYNATTAKNAATFSNSVAVTFTGSGTTDGGLAFGGKFDAQDTQAANAGTAGSVFISGAFGKITMGGVDSGDKASVGQLAYVGYTSLNSGNEISYSADGGNIAGLPGTIDATAARVLYTYSAGGVTANLSSAQLTANGATSYGVGASYNTGALTVGLGYGIVDGAKLTGLKAWDRNSDTGLAALYGGTHGELTQVAVAAVAEGYYETKALDASVSDLSLSASYVIDNTTIKAIYQAKTIEASATAREAVDQLVNTSVTVGGVTPTPLLPIVTAAVHGHGAIALKSTATSMGMSVSHKMEALTLTAYGINTSLDADADQSADNPTVSRVGVGFGYDLGGGATIAGGWARYDAMVPTAVAGVNLAQAISPIVRTADGALETYTLKSVSRNTFDLGVNFKF